MIEHRYFGVLWHLMKGEGKIVYRFVIEVQLELTTSWRLGNEQWKLGFEPMLTELLVNKAMG